MYREIYPKMKTLISLFKAVYKRYNASNAFQMGAAMSYYTVFSLLPILVLVLGILSFFFGESAVNGEFYTQFKSIIGEEATLTLEGLIKNHHTKHNSWFTNIIGILMLALSASGIFSQLHNTFNIIWDVTSKPKNMILHYARKKLIALVFTMLLFFIIFSLAIAMTFIETYLQSIHYNDALITSIGYGLSFLIMILVFMMLYKTIGDAKFNWKALVITSALTSVLFIVGKWGLAKHIASSNLNSTFGTASVLAVIMMWVYYMSQILFLGASFLKELSLAWQLPFHVSNNAVELSKTPMERD